jgi:hypothetical protein
MCAYLIVTIEWRFTISTGMRHAVGPRVCQVGLQFSAWSKYLDQYVDEARYDTRTSVMPVSAAPRISISDFTPLLDHELILHPLRAIRRVQL